MHRGGEKLRDTGRQLFIKENVWIRLLENGDVNIFEHSLDLVDRFQSPLLYEATQNENNNPEHERARNFMTRFKLPAITEKKERLKFVDLAVNKPIREKDIDKFAIQIYNVDRY